MLGHVVTWQPKDNLLLRQDFSGGNLHPDPGHVRIFWDNDAQNLPPVAPRR